MNDPRLTAAAFDITWRNGAYYVSIPNLDHETVVPASLAEEIARENRVLRRMLAVCYGGTSLYTDDGELQDNSQYPLIDFKRNSVEAIQEAMKKRVARALAEESSSLPGGPAAGKITP